MLNRVCRGLSALAGIFALLGLQGLCLAAPAPNVVLIVSDDQGWKDYGYMGHPHLRTPHLDRLARESLVYARGYVPNSLCRPSLASIITGRYAHQHRIVGNDPPLPPELRDLPPKAAKSDPRYLAVRRKYIEHIDDELTLPKLLADGCGALSLQTGKWWEGHFSRGGFTHGMTHGDMQKGARHGDVGLKIGREGMAPIAEFLDAATRQQKPFFVWYAPMLPHSPHNPPERLVEHYRSLTPHLEIAKYWAMCEWFDETVGELLGELDRRDLAQNTIVLYVADNGWINKPDADAFDPRSKKSQYDGGIRTPIMIRWPGKVTPRRDDKHLASSLDLVPTILATCKIAAPADLPGIDLLDRSAVEGRKAIFGEILEHDIQDMNDPVASLRFRWIIDGNWKVVVPQPTREPRAVVELYRLSNDPDETTNLAAAHPDMVRQLSQKLDAWWTP